MTPTYGGYCGGMSDVSLFSTRLPTPMHRKWTRLKWFMPVGSLRPPKFVSARRLSSRHARRFAAWCRGDQSVVDWHYIWGKGSFVCWPRTQTAWSRREESEVNRKEIFSSPDRLLIDAGSSHKPPLRKKKVSKSKVPASPPPQVISQSVNSCILGSLATLLPTVLL